MGQSVNVVELRRSLRLQNPDEFSKLAASLYMSLLLLMMIRCADSFSAESPCLPPHLKNVERFFFDFLIFIGEKLLG